MPGPIRIAALVSALVAMSTTASAATVEIVGDRLVGIRGLEVGGLTYDVTFAYDNYANLSGTGAYQFFGDRDSAVSAATAIVQLLNDNNVRNVGPIPPDNTSPPLNASFYIPYDNVPGPGYPAPPQLWTAAGFGFSPWMLYPDVNRLTAFNDVIPLFSTVPLPPAVWLFTSAMGAMSWMRRRSSRPKLEI